MVPERAGETLKELGYVLTLTSAKGGQKWTLPAIGHSLYIPGPKGIQEIPEVFISNAREISLKACIKDVAVLAEEPNL